MRSGLNVRQKAVNNAALPTPARPCAANEITFGGKCLNCGGVNGHAPQPKKY
jgi:hypothetical protein